jgi:hypothetical protein
MHFSGAILSLGYCLDFIGSVPSISVKGRHQQYPMQKMALRRFKETEHRARRRTLPTLCRWPRSRTAVGITMRRYLRPPSLLCNLPTPIEA